jgi:hypothetical protein
MSAETSRRRRRLVLAALGLSVATVIVTRNRLLAAGEARFRARHG